MLSAAALKKRLLERQAASSASSPFPESNGRTIEDSNKASSEKNPEAGDKVPGAFERLLLEGAEIPAGGDGYV